MRLERFPKPFRFFLVTAAQFSCLVAVAVLADTQQARAEFDLSIKLSTWDLTEDFARFLANKGRIDTHVASKPGTVRDIVVEVCGDAPAAYEVAVELANARQGGQPIIEYDTPVQVGQQLFLPPCPPPRLVGVDTRRVAGGDSLWRFFESNSAGFSRFEPEASDAPNIATGDIKLAMNSYPGASALADPAALDRFPSGSNSTIIIPERYTYLDTVKTLNPRIADWDKIATNNVIAVPQAVEQWFSIPLSEEATRELQEGSLPISDAADSLGVEPAEIDVGEQFESFTDLSDESCENDGASDDEISAIVRILVENKVALSQQPSDLADVTIRILDSGLYQSGRFPLPAEFVRRPVGNSFLNTSGPNLTLGARV